MTTEDDFQRTLDENPHDWQTRLVFADWLQDLDDPRAEGYRALGMLRRRPLYNAGHRGWFFGEHAASASIGVGYCVLPTEWLTAAGRGSHYLAEWSEWRSTRREAEDAAALAFAKLPAERRAELLAETKQLYLNWSVE